MHLSDVYDCVDIIMSFLPVPDMYHLGLTCKIIAQKLPRAIEHLQSFSITEICNYSPQLELYYHTPYNSEALVSLSNPYKHLQQLTICQPYDLEVTAALLPTLASRNTIKRFTLISRPFNKHYNSIDTIKLIDIFPNLKTFCYITEHQPNPSDVIKFDSTGVERDEIIIPPLFKYYNFRDEVQEEYFDFYTHILEQFPRLRKIPEYFNWDFIEVQILSNSITSILQYMITGARMDDFVKFKTSYENWKLIGFTANSTVRCATKIPQRVGSKYHISSHHQQFTLVNHLLRVAGIVLLQKTKGSGSYASNYNKWIKLPSVQFVLEAIKLLIQDGYEYTSTDAQIATLLDVFAESEGAEYSTRKATAKMFSFAEFMNDQNGTVVEPPKKKAKLE